MTEKKGLTPKQYRLKLFIKVFTEEHGYAPSYNEMAEHMNVKSIGNMTALLRRMHEKGHVAYSYGGIRQVRVL